MKKLKQMFTKKGFRTPQSKEQEVLRKKQEYQDRANAFIEDYKKLVEKHGMDFKSDLKLVEVPKTPEVKPWSEALQANLDNRINCEHEDNENMEVCSKCRIGKTLWGENDKGVTEDYIKGEYEKINKEKKREENCKKGYHRLNEEGEKDKLEKGAVVFCKYCRKLDRDMTEDDKKNLLTEETDVK